MDFLFHLSSSNNEPVYDVAIYLLHHNLNSIGFYNIDTDYKIIRFEACEFDSVTEFLTEVKKTLIVNDEWIFMSDESVYDLADNEGRKLRMTSIKAEHSFLKKSELLSFEPLIGLLHFESTSDVNHQSQSIEQQLSDSKLEIGKLKQVEFTNCFSMCNPTIEHNELKTHEYLSQELAAAATRIADLNDQLTKANIALVDISTKSNSLSNIQAQNIKKIAIKQFNRSLAIVLRDLDYQNKLRKGDIVSFITPYMKELTFILADEDAKKAENLAVSYDTLYDTHLQGLKFKTGRQNNDEKNKINIELLFKKQLPITE